MLDELLERWLGATVEGVLVVPPRYFRGTGNKYRSENRPICRECKQTRILIPGPAEYRGKNGGLAVTGHGWLARCMLRRVLRLLADLLNPSEPHDLVAGRCFDPAMARVGSQTKALGG